MKKERRKINALDVALVLLVAAAVAAFLFRGRLLKLFDEEGTQVVTYSFRVSQADPQVASYLTAGTKLLAEDGSSLGEVLVCTSSNAESEETLINGKVVRVVNGKLDLTGSVTAKGFSSGDFITLNNGTLLVPGGTLRVSTGLAVFVLTITAVQAQ